MLTVGAVPLCLTEEGVMVDERGFEFLVPRLYEGPRFHRLSKSAFLLATDEERVLVNTCTCHGLPTAGPEPPGQPAFQVDGSAIVARLRTPRFWNGVRLFVPFRTEGRLVIYRERVDPADMTVHIHLRANDLNEGDAWDFERGHDAFQGTGVEDAVFVLRQALEHGDPEIRCRGALALWELLRHRDHGCFSAYGLAALRMASSDLRSRVLLEEDPDAKEALRLALAEL